MTTPTPDAVRELTTSIKRNWERFLETYEPFRPELYKYCRSLTRSPWDADDLVQETMSRAFVTLGTLWQVPLNPRAWLFKVASNEWIDQLRRRSLGEEHATNSRDTQREEKADATGLRDVREAAGTLIGSLSPQERAAVVLKDVFDFSLEEIAEALSTSVGAVKAALHGGRGKLIDEKPIAPERAPAKAVLDAFVSAFHAGDLEGLVSLLLDTGRAEVVRVTTNYGKDAVRTGAFFGMLFGSRRMAGIESGPCGMEPKYQLGVLPNRPRLEVRELDGVTFLLHWYAHQDGEFVRALTRIETDGDCISLLRNYFFTPDVIAEVCTELGVPFRVNGYRYW